MSSRGTGKSVQDAEPKARAPSREETKAATREALVAAAIEAFAAEGLEAPSLDAICARAGYTRGAFYVHFRDRDELIAAVMERVIEALLGLFLQSAGTGDLRRTIDGFATAVAQDGFPLPSAVMSHQLMQACVRSPLLKDRYATLIRGAMRRVSEVARRGQADGSVRTDIEAERVGELLIAIVLGLQTLSELEVEVDAPGAAGVLNRVLARRD